jgi:formylglycine-generating enzyme required for sulfatase activity
VDAHPRTATPEGVLDLLGNVWEWVEPAPGLPGPAPDQAIALGGSFRHACSASGAPRAEIGAAKAYPYVGFRCATEAT